MSSPLDDRDTVTRSLSPERFARVRALFEAALDRPARERRAYLEGACGADRALFEVVEGMLIAEGKGDGLLDGTTSSPPSSTSHEEGRFPAGTVLAGRYRILGMLGRGGMGEVYKAFDLILNQVVALKFLNPSHVSEAALARFRNEVRIARQVSHPNVCRVYDLGMVEGLHFLSMEYIDGEDLASLLRRIGRLPQDKAMEFTRKICAGLGAAHERGVLHRDLKPANIMIDGRGQPRITDFGLAGLAAEIPLSDLRSGTPAYMSPEQTAGREVTTKSDLYSLGLVMYEMFTGKARKDTQSSPSEIVKDLDPAIERLILRCLEEEPKRRPSTALSVAMGLPGGDPIAAALAAGETPSPEMIAASQEKEGFSARTAILCFLLLLVAFGAAIAWHSSNTLVAYAPIDLPPDAMAERARQLLRSAGYSSAPGSMSYRYECCTNLGEYLLSLPPVARNETVASHRPAIATFYYQQNSSLSTSGEGWFPGEAPRPLEMIRVQLDAVARLLRLEVSPERNDPPSPGPVQWEVFFEYAGLDLSRFVAVAPDPNPFLPLDEQFAWEGDWGANRKERVRVEAGSRGGRPALFRVLPRVATPTLTGANTGADWVPTLMLAILAAVAVWTLILAVRNHRQGRHHKRGAHVLLWFALISGAVYYALAPRDVSRLSPPLLLLLLLLIGPLYVASEPYIRRNWPDALISWSRFCAGKTRDTLVASHVLSAAVLAEILNLTIWPPLVAAGAKGLYWGIVYDGLASTGNAGATFANWSGAALLGMSTGLALALAVTQFRLVIRKLWIADTLATVALLFLFTGPSIALPLIMPLWLGDLWLLRRHGFLAFVAAWVLQTPGLFFPLTATGWLSSISLVYHSVPVLVGAWALWVILSAERPKLEETRS